MAYTVKSSERLRPSAADTETKALLCSTYRRYRKGKEKNKRT